ncbi:MAG TPA: hypothetical protein VN524_14560 [Hyphomicrobiaceae bacterium]|jgi:hypothetical protein|nr:hypothetical protein [Hyphomicrobiaceae bacterium]
MAQTAPERNPSLYLLRDNLEATLALGEDLLSAELTLPAQDRPGLRDWIRQTRDLDGFLGSLRTLEYAMTARLLQARKWAEDLRRSDARLKPLIALFVAGTVPLVDAAAELGDTDARDFDCDDAALTFLRRRGMLAPDAAGLELVSRFAVGEDYQVAGRIGLGPLLDLVASFLDTLDTLYGPDIAPIEEVPVLSVRARDSARQLLEPSAVN